MIATISRCINLAAARIHHRAAHPLKGHVFTQGTQRIHLCNRFFRTLCQRLHRCRPNTDPRKRSGAYAQPKHVRLLHTSARHFIKALQGRHQRRQMLFAAVQESFSQQDVIFYQRNA